MSKTIQQTEYRDTIEATYWVYFIEWLRVSGFDPRNGEDIGTLFWYWYLQTVPTDTNFTVKITHTMPKDNS